MANTSRPLDFIKQTSKAILFEKFNPSAIDLYTLINNEDVRKKDEFFKLIEDNLEVKSFEQFAEKFMPSVWEWIETTGDLNSPVSFRYSLEKPDHIPSAHELKLDKNEFYSMVMKLYDQKGNGGVNNLEFDYSMVAELLSPQKVLDRAKQLRRDLEYNYGKLIELGEGSKLEKNRYTKQINTIRKEIISQYNDSFTGIIKLALADTSQKLAMLTDNSSKDKGAVTIENGNSKQPCLIGFDSNGELDIQPVLIQDNNSDTNGNNKDDTRLLQLISSDYDKYNNQTGGEFVKNIVTTTYCNDTQLGVINNREELIEKRNMYTALYKNSQEQFIRAISSAIEKVLNVKAFFEQAVIPGKSEIPSSLIITNCSVEKLLEDNGDKNIKKDLEFFLRESSRESGEGKIWFAIIPAIGDSDFIDNVDEDISLDDLFVDFDNNVNTTDGESYVSLYALKEMLNILKEAHITTFFNFKANEKTGFSEMNEKTLQQYRSKLESVNGNRYAVFAYPNFTVLPKKETYIKIGQTEYDTVKQDEYIDIPGIYIDASYIAAGLVIASQNPDYLAKKYSSDKICSGYPCVRFDFERENNRFIMLTKMNREGKVSWSSEVEDDISKDKFGFCFCGNTKYYNNKLINNTYVFTARNMNKESDGQYEPMYKRLTMDFVEQYLRVKSPSVVGNSIKTSDVEVFINSDVREWVRSAEDDYENNILRSNGDVTESIQIENNKLKIKFQGKETEMDIEITNE